MFAQNIGWIAGSRKVNKTDEFGGDGFPNVMKRGVTNFPRDWVRDSEFRGPELFSPLSYLRSEGAYGIGNSGPIHI